MYRVFNLIIAGSRTFKNYFEARRIVSSTLSNRNPKEVTIISGGARGADNIGEMFAKEFGTGLSIYKADWDSYGKKAGHIRNEEMAKVGDGLLLFWDGESKGSQNMMFQALDKNIPVFVVYFDPITQKVLRMEDESNPF